MYLDLEMGLQPRADVWEAATGVDGGSRIHSPPASPKQSWSELQ